MPMSGLLVVILKSSPHGTLGNVIWKSCLHGILDFVVEGGMEKTGGIVGNVVGKKVFVVGLVVGGNFVVVVVGVVVGNVVVGNLVVVVVVVGNLVAVVVVVVVDGNLVVVVVVLQNMEVVLAGQLNGKGQTQSFQDL